MKDEDYDDEIEESIVFCKNENLNRVKINETKNNNLNEIFYNQPFESPLKFYTSPDDISDYRASYPYSNFSFTPQSQLNINEVMAPNLIYPKNYVFPTIHDNNKLYEERTQMM